MSTKKKIQYVIILVAVIAAIFLCLQAFKNFNTVTERADNGGFDFGNYIRNSVREKQDLQKKLNELEKENQDLASKIQAQKIKKPVIVAAKQSTKPKSVSCETFRSLVAQYPWNVDTAMAVMRAESGCNPNTVSHTNDHGLFQIHNGLATFGNAIYDPAFNVKLAYEGYYKKRGWKPWSAYKNGSYLKYL